ncbi:MAG TPA: hypothetical protein PKC40_12570, partial [Saprospiraceae bacterium]|nr:hypothetical protein [Saprospiraceae bacterium]
GDKNQEIYFAEIIGERIGKGNRDEKATETRASGQVAQDAQFYIDRKTEFFGTIGLQASSKNLNFDGFARLDAPNLPQRDWFTIKSEADKKDLKIAFSEPKNTSGEPLAVGLFLSKETSRIYPRVMQPLYFRKDRPLLPMKGLFKYELDKDRFVFGDSAKVAKSALAGNQLIFNNKDASVEVEGKFNVGSGLKYQKVTVVGQGKTGFEMATDSSGAEITLGSGFSGNFMAGIELVIPERLLKIIVNDIKSSAFDAGLITSYVKNKDFYRKGLAELVPEGSKDFNEAIQSMNVVGFDLPKKYNPYSFFFTYLPMKWDNDYQSLVSAESKLGVYSIAGEVIDKMLTAYVEFKMPSNEDDRLYIYIKSPGEFYYFFGFQQGVMNIVSNNTQFQDEVINMKKKEAVVKMADDEIYEIAPVEPGTAEMFVRRIEATMKK